MRQAGHIIFKKAVINGICQRYELEKDEYNQVLSRVSELETDVSALEEVKHDVVDAHPVGSIVWVTTDEEPNLGGVWEKVTGLTETTIFAYKRTA